MTIKKKYPETYNYVDENSLTFLSSNKELENSDFEVYLNTIQSQLKMIKSFRLNLENELK